jgi:hypothetical protein
MAGKRGDQLTPEVYDQQFVEYIDVGGSVLTKSGITITYARYEKYTFYDGNDVLIAATKDSGLAESL